MNVVHEHKHLLDTMMYACAAIAAGLSFAKIAFALSILAAAISIICGAIRLYDRFVHGSWNGPARDR